MELFELINKEDCLVGLDSESKLEVLDTMISKVSANHNLDKDELFKKVLERENQMSTGLGDNVAIPHCKAECIDKIYICVATTKSMIEYDSLDGKPCNLFFLVLAPTNKSTLHVEALSLISRLVRSDLNRRLLTSSRDQEELYSALVG